jgi:hypothetical protein
MLRGLAFATLLTGSALLLGCTHEDGGTALQTTMPADFGFHYLDEGPSAKLAYGQANSDNVGLMLQCAKGSRTVEVSDVVRSDSAPTMTLASAGRRSDIAMKVQPGPGAAVATGRTSAAAPALAAFRKSGRIEVSYAGLKYGMAAKPQERASVERFFAACDRAA